MKPQTADNLRCLAAAVLILAVLTTVFGTHSAWVASLPAWIQVAAVVLLLFGVLRVFNFGGALKRDQVSFDDSMITRTLPDGKIETVRWDDLQEVGILTTDEGPAMEDVYWMLLGKNGGCAVSGSAKGMKELLNRLQRLPEFDNEVVIRAMGSTRNDKFVCWKRPS